MEIAKLLLKKGANINSKADNGISPLMIAVATSQGEVVHFLVKNGAEINQKSDAGYTALDVAEDSGNEILVQLLKENGGISEKKSINSKVLIMIFGIITLAVTVIARSKFQKTSNKT